MDTQPLLGSQSNTSGDIEAPFPQPPHYSPPPSSSNSHQKSPLHRSRTAPAITPLPDDLPSDDPQMRRPPPPVPNSIVIQAVVFLAIYLLVGVAAYCFFRRHFSGAETHPVVDALYFCVVTMCTIGYGDIAPLTSAAKAFTCFFVLFAFGVLDVVLTGFVNYALELQENIILAGIKSPGAGAGAAGLLANSYIVDAQKGRMRIRTKVALALAVVVSCIGAGTLVLFFVERLDWIDSIYVSVMSVTTVGYGDRAFKTLPGRLFASIWLLFSTLAVARAFLYLTEARIDKRHRRITKWILGKEVTVEDLLAADVNNNGFISKSEFVLHKLKEMGTIVERDILQICAQFEKLDFNNSGKIKLLDLLESRR